MKIHIPEQNFEIDSEGYGRIKFDLKCEDVCLAPEPSVDSSIESEVPNFGTTRKTRKK